MKAICRSKVSRSVSWQQRGSERLRQALHHLQRLLAVDRPPEALALIPIRAAQPPVARQRHQRTGRD